MGILESLGLALGTSFASGLNVYATVAVLGLLQRWNLIQLPGSLEILGHPVVLSVALVLYLIEFVADKVPYVDNLWDIIHTFIRPSAAAVLSYSAVVDMPEAVRLAAALIAGGVALTSHGTKASTRAAANASPEPFSNSFLSIAEDGLAIFLTWMAATHPFLTAFVILVLLAGSIVLLVKFFGFLKRRMRRGFRSVPA